MLCILTHALEDDWHQKWQNCLNIWKCMGARFVSASSRNLWHLINNLVLVFALVYHQINNFDDERMELVGDKNYGQVDALIAYSSLCSLPPPVVTNLVDPVLCLRKAYPKYSGPAHGTFVLGSADELKRPHNLRELTQKVFQKFWRNNLLLFNLCYFSKRLICQDFQKTFMKSNEYNIWLIGLAFRCASSFWAINDHSFSD